MRHPDFTRIYDEFCRIYSPQEGKLQYYDWLHAMHLNENREYGQARESYLWKKENLNFVNEDADNKYYEVEVGFPTKSMNGNVYKERDLIAASLTLKGKHPSLNHKNQFWFSPKNPDNRWGNIEIVDGKYHEGISKALIKVPKDMICPICNGKKMTELIDSRRILNVSLEGDCADGRCPTTGKCEGFYYTDPPFTLLTTSVLPGIPMTRIRPIESFINLQSSNNRGTRKETVKKTRRIKIVPKTREDREPGQMGMTRPPTTGKDSMDTSVYRTNDLGTGTGPTSANLFRGTLSPVSQQTRVESGTDPAQRKPEGVWTTSQSEGPNVTPKEATTGTVLTVKPSDQPTVIHANPPMPEVDSHQGPDKTGSISPDLTKSELPGGETPEPKPAMAPIAPSTMTPKPAHACPEGHHWTDDAGCVPDVNEPTHDVLPKESDITDCPEGQHKDQYGNCVDNAEPAPSNEQDNSCEDGMHWDPEKGQCVADDNTEERVRRWKAEDKARNWEGRALSWEQRYIKEHQIAENLKGRNYELKTVLSQASNRKEDAIREMHNATVERDRYSRLRQEATAERDDYKLQYESLYRKYKLIENKYNESMKINLSLSQKLTESNESYLALAQKSELLNEKLQLSRKKAKQIVKLKV